MKITKEIIEKTAHLARLDFTTEEEKEIQQDLQNMVDWVDKLREVNTDGVEPLISMATEVNRFREDDPGTHLPREQALKNAPQKDEQYFRVPKVIK